MLLCNPGKTEVIQFSSRFVRSPVLSHFSFGNTIIELSDKVRDLGVILDKELNLRQRIVNAFVISRIDCCNSILYGLHTIELEKLQRV